MTTISHVPLWTVQDKLRKAREDADLSQVGLARELGVSSKTVYRAETPGTEVRRPLMLAWAMATGVDADWLLGSGQWAPRGSNPEPTGYWTLAAAA